MKEYGDTFLLAPFREFYREVIRLRGMVVTGTWAPAASNMRADDSEEFETPPDAFDEFPELVQVDELVAGRGARAALQPGAASDAGRAGSGASPSADSNGGSQLVPAGEVTAGSFVLQNLVSLLKRQEQYARRYGVAYYKKAQYVMVALADEIFLNTKEWEGHVPWVSNLLESKVFRTHVAGERIFQNLDRMLAKRDPVDRELAAVYLMALSLGFRGKYHGDLDDYHGRDDRRQLDAYRRRLFHFVFRREPDLDSTTRQMFPEAYYNTLREETTRRLPNPRAWLILLGAVVLAYVTLTHGIWTKLTGRLFVVNEHIHQTVDSLGGGR